MWNSSMEKWGAKSSDTIHLEKKSLDTTEVEQMWNVFGVVPRYEKKLRKNDTEISKILEHFLTLWKRMFFLKFSIFPSIKTKTDNKKSIYSEIIWSYLEKMEFRV